MITIPLSSLWPFVAQYTNNLKYIPLATVWQKLRMITRTRNTTCRTKGMREEWDRMEMRERG